MNDKPKFPYRFPPMPHQRRGLSRAVKAFRAGSTGFGFFWSMGAGKTFEVINLAYYLHSKQDIGAMLVVCPTAIKDVWDVEWNKCAPLDAKFDVHILRAGRNKAAEKWMDQTPKGDPLRVFVLGVEALSQGTAVELMMRFLRRFSKLGTLMAVDESSRVKNATATRTKAVIKAGRIANYRVVMTGTPVSQGLQDLWPQMEFLDPDILKCRSYVLFRNLYCVMGGYQGRSIIGYQREDELMAKIRPYVDIVTKEEALPELPPKTYTDVRIDMTKAQKDAVAELEEAMKAEQGDDVITVSTVMDRLTRYQQILGGFFPYEDEETKAYRTKPIAGKNPKLEALLQLLELDKEAGIKTIIWARFTPERNAIVEALNSKYGEGYARLFDGQVSDHERRVNTSDFQLDPTTARVMVSNVVVGGMGQTWTAATHEVYYSNDFSYENRMQSEDRAHRKGQKNAVKYTDIIVNHPADMMITKALAKKGDVADYVQEALNNGELEL